METGSGVMVDHARLDQALQDFVTTVTGAYHIGEVLDTLTDAAVAVLGCAATGVALTDDGGLGGVSASGAGAARAQVHEAAAREGPGHDALRNRTIITTPQLAEETRWPAFRQGLSEAIGALAAIPLQAHGQPIGALVVYWHESHRLTDEESAAAHTVADMAAAYLANLELPGDTGRLEGQLRAVAAAGQPDHPAGWGT